MSIPKSAAAARIRTQLRDAEAKFDEALLASANLMATMVLARANPEVEVHTGQKALLRLAQAQRSMLNGSSNLFRVHDELVVIGRELAILDEPSPTSPSRLADDDRLDEAA